MARGGLVIILNDILMILLKLVVVIVL